MGIDALKNAIDCQLLEQRVGLMLRCNPRLSLSGLRYSKCLGWIHGADSKQLRGLPLKSYGLVVTTGHYNEPYYNCHGKGVICLRREDE